ncbi:hypothetical protein Mpet_2692 [Methanolacinia petrolearia DSM 11571]|uniref:HEPN domain protein n=1 Tax=Methanolacinia petrolearia (strain DSM 11571 / OCM 486 / SEBR 4847) TaxID=679926 RepID=E1RGC1_METP4|nr:hypothetical protein [Methanolacinia petrolearia]ADN37435.1 hypothetical protein Mpet_2692 [Methanolacinia petrolearia DSM 11571]
MRTKFEECVRKGLISKANIDPTLVNREITDAEEDLKSGHKALEEHDFIRAMISGRNSQIHSIRALVFSEGYREKKVPLLVIAAESLLLDKGLIRSEILEDFEYAMKYENPESEPEYLHESIAEDIMRGSDRIFKRAKIILEKNI